MPTRALVLYGISVLGFLFGEAVAGQEPARIVVGPNIRASGDAARPYVEPMIAVNPADSDNLVGASMRIDSTAVITVALVSRDGGRSWSETPVPSCGWDPWVAFLPSGVALVSCLAQGGGPDAVLVVRSEDGGATWGTPTELPVARTSYDHPTLVVDTTDGAGRGTVYVVAGHVSRSATDRSSLVAPAVVRSVDGGRTFSAPVRVAATNAWSMVLSPVVLVDGSLGFGFVEYAVDARAAGRGVEELRTPRVWWARSDDRGRTLTMPHLVAEIHEMSRWGHVAADGSTGPFRGRVYTVVDDFRDGAGGVFVYHSADRGESWSSAVRASEPDSMPGMRRTPTVAVNHRGEVLAAWLDPQDDPDRACWRLLAAASVDGGETFLPPAAVSETAYCNVQPGNVVPLASGPAVSPTFDAAARWPGGGDYFGLAAHPDGSFRMLWADSRSGVFQLWTASIHLEEPEE